MVKARVSGLTARRPSSDWHFDVRNGAFQHEGGEALVFEVSPATAFGFGKGEYSQTRWRFG